MYVLSVKGTCDSLMQSTFLQWLWEKVLWYSQLFPPLPFKTHVNKGIDVLENVNSTLVHTWNSLPSQFWLLKESQISCHTPRNEQTNEITTVLHVGVKQSKDRQWKEDARKKYEINTAGYFVTLYNLFSPAPGSPFPQATCLLHLSAD